MKAQKQCVMVNMATITFWSPAKWRKYNEEWDGEREANVTAEVMVYCYKEKELFGVRFVHYKKHTHDFLQSINSALYPF